MNNYPNFSWNPIHPRRDWSRVLIVFMLLAVVVVVWSTYLFFTAGIDRSSLDALPVTEMSGTSKQIEKISSFFEKRSESAMMPVAPVSEPEPPMPL